MPKRSLDEAADRINGGGVVAFPTETVYGLGARIDHIPALDRIFELKGRPGDNPLIVHISTLDMLRALTPWHDHPKVKALADVFWPGPLALVVPRSPIVPDRVTAGLDTVAIRMPNHPLALQLIERTGPLAAPSANRSGRPSPTRAGHVDRRFWG
jgi:L-threonylcarbamoyladenylate synthase